MNAITPEQIVRDGLPRAAEPQHIGVIGAGMAGLVAALELKRAGHRVTVLEAQARVGGRVQTLREPFSDGLFAEAGAMRIPRAHDLTLAYVRRFKLRTMPFTMDNPEAFIYLLNERRRAKDYRAEDSVMARWAAALAPLVRMAHRGPQGTAAVAARHDHQSLAEFVESIGFTQNEVELFALVSTMEPLMNTAFMEVFREEAGHWFTNVLTIRGGMDQLPRAFVRELAGDLRFGAAVTGIAQGSDGVSVAYESAGARRTLRVDRVIVTLPFGVLRHIEVRPGLSREKQRAIRQLHYDASTKILFQCSRRFWEEDHGIFGGGTVTDLPIRSIYYPDQGRETGRGVLLASYTWGIDAVRWAALPPHERVRQALENVAAVHPEVLDHFELGTSKVWQDDPYAGGAFALFEPGQQTALYTDICKPEGRIHFAGEHASLAHAWIQGAIESGLRAAAEVAAVD